jgi:hypothetical protein
LGAPALAGADTIGRGGNVSRRTGKGRAGAEAIGRVSRAANANSGPEARASVASLVNGPSLATARIQGVEGDRVRISIGRQTVLALRDESLHPAVLKGAQERGERVLVERDPEGVWVVLGALRTQPTPGIDVVPEFTIEADRVIVKGHAEVTIAAEEACVAVRAEGEIESHAPRIVSRAEGLHKITGRMLRLN